MCGIVNSRFFFLFFFFIDASETSVVEAVREELKHIDGQLKDGFNAVGSQLREVHGEVRFDFFSSSSLKRCVGMHICVACIVFEASAF